MRGKQPPLNVYFSLPSVIHTTGKLKRSGVPSICTRPYETKAILPEHTFIKYKPDAFQWNLWLRQNNQKLIYGLYDATELQTPRYIGETQRPLKRVDQHIKEAVVLNNPSHKSKWIRKCCNRNIQIIMRPLLIVPFKKRQLYEKTIRCLLKQLGYPIFNGARLSRGVYKVLEENKIQQQQISPHMLELIYNNIDTDSVICDKLIESIQ